MDIRSLINETLKVTEEDLVAADAGTVESPEAMEAPEAQEAQEVPEITPELIDSLIAEIPELADCDKEMLMRGMLVELEHIDSVGGDIGLVAMIACDHIKEFPGKDYYIALEAMEHELAETPGEEEAEHAEGGEEGPAATETPAGEETIESLEEGRNERGKRDGTGPYKGSFRRKSGLKGRRRQLGLKCPVLKEEINEPIAADESKNPDVTEGKKEDKATAEKAEAITKSSVSLLRKIHKATELAKLEEVMDMIEKSATNGKINAEQETRLKDALKRRKETVEKNPKTPETEPTAAEEQEVEEGVKK